MAENDSLYPNYPGNPQTLDPAYTEGDDTVAGATDYNKHDDEILKHQDLLANLRFNKIDAVGVELSAASGLTTLNFRTGAGINIVGNDTTKTITISSSTLEENLRHTALLDMPDISGTNTDHDARYQQILSTGAGIAIVGNTINGTNEQNLFETIDVVGTDIIADTLKTTLNFRTGAGIQIVADNGTKTITISASDPQGVHSSLLNLDYASSAHTGFQSELTLSDFVYTTGSNMSGALKVITPISDTDATNKVYVDTRTGASTSHTHIHNTITALDYASAAHTGFQPTLSTGAGINISGSTISAINYWNINDNQADLIGNKSGTFSLTTTNTGTFGHIIDSELTSGYLPYANVSKQLVNSPITTDGVSTATIPTLNLGSSTGVSATASAGVLTLAGLFGTLENMTLDFTGNNRIAFGTTSGAIPQFNNGFIVLNDQNTQFGNSSDAMITWETTGNNNLQLGTICGTTSDSGYVSLMEKADMGNANRSPTSAWPAGATSLNPVLGVLSSNEAVAGEGIFLWHDQTDANIANVTGNINLKPASLVNVSKDVAATNSLTEMLRSTTTSTGTVAAGFGNAFDSYLEDASGVTNQAGRTAWLWTDPANATRTSAYTISGTTNAGAITEWARLVGTHNGMLRFTPNNAAGIAFFGATDTDYSITMSDATDGTYGGRLDSTSDYNMYLRMTGGTNRGFVFCNNYNLNPVAQIDSTGAFYSKAKIFLYNNVATEGYGVPAIVDHVALTGQLASIGTTNFTNAGTAGLYRVNYYLEATTLNAGATSVLATFGYTDDAGATTTTSATLILTALGRTSGIFYVQLASGNLTYATTLVDVSGLARYALYMTCERVN